MRYSELRIAMMRRLVPKQNPAASRATVNGEVGKLVKVGRTIHIVLIRPILYKAVDKPHVCGH